MTSTAHVEELVKDRYRTGAGARVPELCCPVDYDPRYLEAIPREVLERDYGCGDPSQHVRPGETVLDLGSGTGKICFIASQVVGPEGRVIGVDMTHEMLDVARAAAPVVAERIGFANVEFRRGRIQDLALDLDRLDARLAERPVTDADGLLAAQALADELRATEPLVASDSVDVVVSNCVLNLVASAEKERLFREIHRVLRRGGRAVISDIVSDEAVPEELQRDPELWSGCISGALTEDGFLEAFERAGFYGVRILERQPDAWQTVRGDRAPVGDRRGVQGQGGGVLGAQPGGRLQGPVQGGARRRRPSHGARPALRGVRQDLPDLRPRALPAVLRADRAAGGDRPRAGAAVRLLAHGAARPAGDQGRRLRRDHRGGRLLRADRRGRLRERDVLLMAARTATGRLRLALALGVATIALGLAACGAPANGGATTTGASVLRVNGSTTVNPVVTRAAEILHDERGLDITVDTQGGSSGGIAALGEGRAEVAMSSRPVIDHDHTAYPEVEFRPVRIGADAVALAVSRDVWEGGVHALSRQQVQAIYEGRIDNWSAVGGPDEPIVFYDKEPGRGTWEVFAHWAYGDPDAAPQVSHLEIGSNEEGRTKVASTPGAVTQLSFAWTDGETVVPLAVVTDDGETVAPTPETVADGSYPISRQLLVITDGEPSPVAGELIDFLLSDRGQQVVRDAGYVPLAEVAPTAGGGGAGTARPTDSAGS